MYVLDYERFDFMIDEGYLFISRIRKDVVVHNFETF